MPALSIITAVRNQLEYNKVFLESLAAYTGQEYELIIIDNGSTDGSGEYFAKHGAIVLRNEHNLCYSCSQNLGIARSTGAYLTFLNNDIYLSKDWDRRLIDYLEEYGLDVISPCGTETLETQKQISRYLRRWRRVNTVQRIRRKTGRHFTEKNLLALIRRMYGDWDAFIETRAAQFKRFLYPGISGFALLARRTLFDVIGPWTPEVSASDFDLRLRLIKNHVERGQVKQPMIAGDVFVHHFIRTTTRSVRDPYRCTHPLTSFDDFYNENDRRYARIPSVSVIIAVYNKPDFLEKVLASLQNQVFKDFEVVIADDGSGAEIKTCISKFQEAFPYPVRQVWHDDQGFRKTIIANKAVIASRSDYLVFIDGDSILHHRFLREHLRCRRVGTVLSGRRVMLDEPLTSRLSLDDVRSRRIEKPSFWMRHCEKPSIRHGVYSPLVNRAENVLHGRRNYHILGANFSLYKGDYYRINGYDERIIGRGLEDDNLANRFKAGGVRIRSISRRAIQYHLHHSSDPVPHSKDTIKELGTPARAWSAYGLIKQEEDSGILDSPVIYSSEGYNS